MGSSMWVLQSVAQERGDMVFEVFGEHMLEAVRSAWTRSQEMPVFREKVSIRRWWRSTSSAIFSPGGSADPVIGRIADEPEPREALDHVRGGGGRDAELARERRGGDGRAACCS